MKNYLLIILCFFGSLDLAQAQDLDDYKYVQVPQGFDFLSEDNQFQLNDLTAFLFEKYGFEVIYKEQLPENLEICKVMKADVLEDNGLFTTKLKVVLENCKGETIFTSKQGVSREKEYKKAYQEALREAFSSLKDHGYNYSEKMVTITDPEDVVVEGPDAVEESVREKQVAEKAQPDVVEPERINEVLNYRNASMEYTLIPTTSGYDLHKSGEAKSFARLLKSGNGSTYLYASKNVQGSAYFDSSENLVVEYLDSDSGQLVTIKYKLQD